MSCPFGSMKLHDADYDTLQDPSEGFLCKGNLFMIVDLKNIQDKSKYPNRTLGNDMRIISVNTFGNRAITSRLDEGKAFGLVSETRVRTHTYAANLLIREILEYVSRCLSLLLI